jgi:hypothetical protein
MLCAEMPSMRLDSQVASGWFPKFLKNLFSGPERTAASQPERAIGYAAVSN